MEDKERSSSSMELRKKAGISRMDLAIALGVAEGSIAKWEQGKREPHLPLWKFRLWASLCQCTLDELYAAFPAPEEHDLVNQLQTIYAHMEQPIAN
jgi:DNA-binding XRE family transcriptional regulator